MKKFFLNICAVFLSMQVYSQQSITCESNAPRHHDSLTRHMTTFFSAGNQGIDIVWDFTDVETVRARQNLEFSLATDSTMLFLEPEMMSRLLIDKDSLVCTQYETPLKFMKYDRPLTLLTYPFYYGDILKSTFTGSGIYCKRHFLDNEGTYEVEADAQGSIIIAEGDTLKNVIRLHSTLVNSVAMHALGDTLDIDTTPRKQEIEERYTWYARGHRYPVFETRSLTCYDDMEQVSCQQTAYRCLPTDQILQKDSVNDEIVAIDSLSAAGEQDIIRYNATYDGYRLTLDYDLGEDALVRALVCNRTGFLFFSQKRRNQAGEGYQMTFDCSSLKKGIYILYINVNGKVYSEKIHVE